MSRFGNDNSGKANANCSVHYLESGARGIRTHTVPVLSGPPPTNWAMTPNLAMEGTTGVEPDAVGTRSSYLRKQTAETSIERQSILMMNPGFLWPACPRKWWSRCELNTQGAFNHDPFTAGSRSLRGYGSINGGW